MHSEIEFHDSDVTSVSKRDSVVLIGLAAYVHRWPHTGDDAKGTGWIVPVEIALSESDMSVSAECPIELTDGEIHLVDRVLSNLAPLPFQLDGKVRLRLQAMRTGEWLEFSGSSIEIVAKGTGRYVEDLPPDFRPYVP